MVILYAITLRKLAITLIKDYIRLRLPLKIKFKEDTLKDSILLKLIEEYLNKG